MTQSSPKNSRFVAITALHELHKKAHPLSLIFNRLASEHSLQGNDRHLAMNLIYGVLRQRYYLDRLLLELCRQPLKKLQPFVHQALAVGLYQIFFLDRIPDSAAVNETVKAVKTERLPKQLQGFVNGVLRASIRKKESLPSPGAPTLKLKARLNHPQWLINRWQKRFGQKEMASICISNNKQPQLVLRINTLAATRDAFFDIFAKEITIIPGSYAPDAAILPDYHGPIHKLPGYDDGFFQIQDEAAQLVTHLLGPFIKNGTYLDGCAGLGGKTSHLLQLANQHNASITAVEPEERRIAKLKENLTRLYPHKNISFYGGNLQDFAKGKNTLFNGILIDAPCSGTGVIGRHPDIRWNRMESDLPGYQKKQLALLETAANLLKPGGILLYVTCSLEPEENENVIEIFLKKHEKFSLTNCAPHLPEAARKFVNGNFFSPKPSESIDGFFAARLVLEK